MSTEYNNISSDLIWECTRTSISPCEDGDGRTTAGEAGNG